MDFTMHRNLVRAASAAVLAALSQGALANTGRIEFVSGNVTLQNAAGQSRPVSRGIEVGSGDTLRTNDGLVQIRYSDGSIVSLREDAEYTIQSYRFSGATDGSEQGLFRLLKGTMRTVTGLVGRVNKQAYVITTPTSTIGIRGTGGVIRVDPRTGATLLFGTSGTWDLRGPAGPAIPVGAGQTGRAVPGSQPAEQATAPNPAQPAPAAAAQPPIAAPQYQPAENRTQSGTSEVLVESAAGSGIQNPGIGGGIGGIVAPMLGTVGTNHVAFADVATTYPNFYDTVVNMNGSSVASWTTKNLGTLSTAGDVSTTLAGGTLVENGTTGNISWGRITNTTVTQVFTQSNGTFTDVHQIGANGGFYFAVGQPTLDMPKTGSFTYALAGTQPRPSLVSEASLTASLNSGQLTGQFTATGGNFSYNLGLSVNGQPLTAIGTGSIGNNRFNGNGSATGTFCTPSCFSTVNGAFFGPAAANAAAGYLIFSSGTIGGLAVMQKQ
jgi:hypothetical protein